MKEKAVPPHFLRGKAKKGLDAESKSTVLFLYWGPQLSKRNLWERWRKPLVWMYEYLWNPEAHPLSAEEEGRVRVKKRAHWPPRVHNFIPLCNCLANTLFEERVGIFAADLGFSQSFCFAKSCSNQFRSLPRASHETAHSVTTSGSEAACAPLMKESGHLIGRSHKIGEFVWRT